MIREDCVPRADWPAQVEAAGYTWHTDDGDVAWNEAACYVLDAAEVDKLRHAANECYALFEEAADVVVKRGWWDRLGLSEAHAAIVRASWERRDWSLAGRFDFLWDATGQPKLLEFNADNALTMLETAVIQRDWQRTVRPEMEQFNRLHDSLVGAWRESAFRCVHCAWRPRHREVEGTMRYLARSIREADRQAILVAMHCIGWDERSSKFVDRDDRSIEHCCKLYPWEWMLREPFAKHLESGDDTFSEPAWRLLFSSKGMLSVLWELFPGHPALLPCAETPTDYSEGVVRKPFFGREGENIAIERNGKTLAESGGEFGLSRCVYQQFVPTPRYHETMAQMGVWMVRGEAVALGMRETAGLIIGDGSPFVPHVIRKG